MNSQNAAVSHLCEDLLKTFYSRWHRLADLFWYFLHLLGETCVESH